MPAQVKMMCIDGRFQAAVGGPDPFEDWFAWHEEGKDWRRCKGTKAVGAQVGAPARADEPAAAKGAGAGRALLGRDRRRAERAADKRPLEEADFFDAKRLALGSPAVEEVN